MSSAIERMVCAISATISLMVSDAATWLSAPRVIWVVEAASSCAAPLSLPEEALTRETTPCR